MIADQFTSPSIGVITYDQMFQEIIGYMAEDTDMKYKLIVGTDSHLREEEYVFVVAVIIHRISKGGRYFYQKQKYNNIHSLRQKIFYEASLSLHTAGMLAASLAANGLDERFDNLDVEIHLDVGRDGSTRELIREVIGMVTGSGFAPIIKPDSYGASKVADKYTK